MEALHTLQTVVFTTGGLLFVIAGLGACKLLGSRSRMERLRAQREKEFEFDWNGGYQGEGTWLKPRK